MGPSGFPTPSQLFAPTAATNLDPSADEATKAQLVMGALVIIQLAPESFDV
jgi:hypothetical protein